MTEKLKEAGATLAVEPKKRGRPPGTTDSKSRKRRSDRDNLKNLDDKAIEIAANMIELARKPRVDTANRQEVEQRIDEYFTECIEKGLRPSIGGICVSLGISRMAWNYWSRGIDRDYADICKRASTLVTSILEAYMISGKVNPVSGIFLLKNIDSENFHDRTEHEIRTTRTQFDALGEITDEETLRKRYLEQTYAYETLEDHKEE